MTLFPKSSTDHAQIPALDGLRAIAVLGVILFHIYPPALPGGFAGVDVFFVLSGFLITSIILHDIQAGTFSFREFYLRRIQRLLPNAVSTVAVTILLLTFFLPAGLEIFTARHGIWTLFNLSNIYTWIHHGSYWDTNAEWAYFTHFWSLGIEEQYYLLFPLGLFLLARFVPKQVRFWLIIGAVVSFALCFWGTYNRAAFTFYWLPTRVWELLLGSFLASAGISIYSFIPGKRRLPRLACELLGWGGTALILLSFALASGRFAFPGWIALGPTLGSAFILISIICGESTFSRLLSTTPFTAVGKVSYSLYLWHWPLIIFGKMSAEVYGFSHVKGAVIGGSLSFFAGTAAYFLIERPLRRRGPGRMKRLAALAGIFAGTLTLCVWSAWYKPFHISSQFDLVTVSSGYYEFRLPEKSGKDFASPGELPKTIFAYDVSPGKIPGENASRKILEKGGLLHLYGGATPRVVLWGSSHANMYAPMLDGLCRDKKLSVAFFGKSAEPPFLLTTPAFPDSRNKAVREFYEYKMSWIKEWRPDVLFLIERWDRWYAWDNEDLTSFGKQLEAFLDAMKLYPTKVVFVMQTPVSPHGEQINFRAITDFFTKADGTRPVFLEPGYFTDARRAILKTVEDVAAKHSNLLVLRPDKLFFNADGSVRYSSGRKFFYFDEDHLSDAGVEETRPLFDKILPVSK